MMENGRWKQIVAGSCWRRSVEIAAWGLVVCVMGMGLPEVSLAYGCGKVPTTKEWEAGSITHEGFYSNNRFGYAVRIPAGFVGRSVPPPMPQHGFGIILSRYPRGVLWVDGSVNSIDEWVSTDAMVETYVERITQDAQQVFSIEKQPVTWDGHPAIRLIARFQCPDGTLMVNDVFLMLYSGGITYEIELEADAARYAEYKDILEQIAASWQFRELWNEVVCGNAYPFSSPQEWESVTQWRQYTEEYFNQDYGYAVTIPAGLVGKSDYPTTPMYGAGILLSPEGYLTAEGGCNWPKWASLEVAAETYIRWITAEAYTVDSVEQQPTTLGGIPAIRLTVRYECPAETPMVKDLVLAMQDGSLYKVDLVATGAKYDEYRPILEQFAGTFRLTGEAKESCQWEQEGE